MHGVGVVVYTWIRAGGGVCVGNVCGLLSSLGNSVGGVGSRGERCVCVCVGVLERRNSSTRTGGCVVALAGDAPKKKKNRERRDLPSNHGSSVFVLFKIWSTECGINPAIDRSGSLKLITRDGITKKEEKTPPAHLQRFFKLDRPVKRSSRTFGLPAPHPVYDVRHSPVNERAVCICSGGCWLFGHGRVHDRSMDRPGVDSFTDTESIPLTDHATCAPTLGPHNRRSCRDRDRTSDGRGERGFVHTHTCALGQRNTTAACEPKWILRCARACSIDALALLRSASDRLTPVWLRDGGFDGSAADGRRTTRHDSQRAGSSGSGRRLATIWT